MKLTQNDIRTLRLDRLAMGDLGLKMPRLSDKYLKGVYQLSSIQVVSPYFIHIAAAQRGRSVVWRWLKGYGYRWNRRNWVKV